MLRKKWWEEMLEKLPYKGDVEEYLIRKEALEAKYLHKAKQERKKIVYPTKKT